MNFIEKYVFGYCRVMLISIFLISAFSSALFVMFGLLIKSVIDNKESLADSTLLVFFHPVFLLYDFLCLLAIAYASFWLRD